MLAKLKHFLAGLSLGAIATAIGAGFFVLGELNTIRQLRREQARPQELARTPATAKAPEKSAPCPAEGLLVPDLKPKDEARLRAKYAKPATGAVRAAQSLDLPGPTLTSDQAAALAGAASGGAGGGKFAPPDSFLAGPAPASPADVILGEFTVPRAPHGGSALATLEPDRRLHLTFKAAPTPYLEWMQTLELGGLYGVGDGGERWRAWAGWEPLRLGHLYLRGEAGGEGRASDIGWYAMAGAVWRSENP